MFKSISNAITSKIGRQILLGQKNSPKILFVLGVVGVTATVVLACKATLKLDEVLDKAHEDLDKAKNLKDQDREDYTHSDYTKDVAVVQIRTAVEIGKMYAPAVVVGLVAIGALAGSHAILSKRNVALTAAYTGLEKAYKEYRNRVIRAVGEETEREIRYSGVKETEEVGEDGSKTKKIERIFDPNGTSMYARFFDQMSSSWSKNPERNLLFLRSQQNYANDRLKTDGYLFLNDVYTMLGIPKSSAGALCGWIISEDGDNFVDFDIYNGDKYANIDFVNGNERAILLDFNVQGVIYHLIDGN